MVVRSIRLGTVPVSVLVTTPPMAPRSILVTTSNSEVTIGYGERTFEVSGINFSVTPGTRLHASAAGSVTDWMEGRVVSYDGATFVMQVDSLSGEGGTFEDWNIGVTGERGAKGDTGERGPDGRPGPATIDVSGDTFTSEPGSPALVTNVGDIQNAKFQFTLPRGQVGPPGIQGAKGDKGNAATVTVVGTITLPSGGNASVVNTGDAHDAKLEFTIPSGGPPGPKGDPGPAIAVTHPFDTLPSGELIINTDPPLEVDAGTGKLKIA